METKDQSQAVAELFNMGLGFLKPMILNCALELGIIHAISNHGEPITLTQLHSALSLPDLKKPYLFHLLRTLNYFHFVHVQGGVSVDYEATYDLTPVSRLVTSKEGINLFPFVRLHVEGIEPCLLKASLSMGEWFKQDDERVPFELAHNCSLWQMASQNPKLNSILNSAMESTGTIFSDAIIKNGVHLFKGVESLVDVAGGAGGVAKVIAANFPHVHCTVLDLPHVVQDLPKDGVVKFIGGDMFDYIPPADAILLKWVLHCLGDDDCVKVLRLCKDAVNSKGSGGGKVVIIEAVVGSSPGTPSEETQLLYDMVMLTMHASAERDEDEWKSLFNRAGFSSYKIVTTIGFMSIMEVYP